MLKRYGEKAFEQSSACADALAADGDHDGASTCTWRVVEIVAALREQGGLGSEQFPVPRG